LHFSSTNAPAGDASADMDDDGYTTFQEYVLGTSPTVTSSRFELHVDNADGTIVVHFTALAATGTGYTSLHRYYALEHCTDLQFSDWQPVPGYDNLIGDNSDVTYNVPAAAAAFYRVSVHLQLHSAFPPARLLRAERHDAPGGDLDGGGGLLPW
jgi:hypothetical protein